MAGRKVQAGELVVAKFDKYKEAAANLSTYAEIVRSAFPGFEIIWEPRKLGSGYAICAEKKIKEE